MKCLRRPALVLSFIIGLSFASSLSAQSPSHIWIQGHGNASDQRGNGLAVDVANNIYLIGDLAGQRTS